MKKIHYTELGATLFVPASHKDILSIAKGEKYPHLQSVVFDTEDAIREESLNDAVAALEKLLKGLESKKPFVFFRPRNPHVLKVFLSLKQIEKIEGFILPKFSLQNAQEYISLLAGTKFFWMPSIEGVELFEEEKLLSLRELFLEHKDSIPLIRFGLEDMLKQLSLRRQCRESAFDLSASSFVLGRFIALFKSVGFGVSGGVYPFYKDDVGFEADVLRDLKEGLFSKTLIHPRQMSLLQELYKVQKEHFEEALEILLRDEAVFAQKGKMAERSTMSPWAKEIVMRAQIYGLRDKDLKIK